MTDLYIQTKYGIDKINEAMINKYKLEKGLQSPFTRERIVDEEGNSLVFHSEIKEITDHPDDEIAQMEHGFMLSTSEMLDIASGVDSDVENTM